MYLIQDTQTIDCACDTYKVTRPKYVLDAQKLAEAADKIVADTNTETVPDLGALSVENISEIHTQMSTISTKPERLAAAHKIQAETQQGLIAAWSRAGGDMIEAFRKPFNDATACFTEALSDLDGELDAGRAIAKGHHKAHASMTRAASEMAELAKARDVLAITSKVDVGHSGLEREGRILTFPDFNTMLNTLKFRTQGTGRYDASWFAAVLNIPGVDIVWNAPGEQQTHAQLAKVKATA